jgi:hypothetical protein
MSDNVDSRLLARFEQSWNRQEAARRLLPERWLQDARPGAQLLNELFVNVLERAHERVAAERALLDRRRVCLGDVCD